MGHQTLSMRLSSPVQHRNRHVGPLFRIRERKYATQGVADLMTGPMHKYATDKQGVTDLMAGPMHKYAADKQGVADLFARHLGLAPFR